MRILLAEDDAVSCRLLELTLKRWNYEVETAVSGLEAWSVLQSASAPPIAILDWMMPGLTGPELCRMVRAQNREPYTYLLLVTARGEKRDVIAGLEAGADDYIVKPFDIHELEVRLRAGKRIIDLQLELMEARETLRIQATHDSLSGLWNRPEILRVLECEDSRTLREGLPLSVAVADIDHFKRVNDSLGHQVGDRVLQEVANRIAKVIRRYDAVGRYGGEEFLTVLPGTGEAESQAVAERIRAAVGDSPIAVEGRDLPITLSIGVATRKPPDALPIKDIIAAADCALYAAKADGRNRVSYSAVSRSPLPTSLAVLGL